MKKIIISLVGLLMAVQLSAQDISALYNEAAAAFGVKDFTVAAAKFGQVVEQGKENPNAMLLVSAAQSAQSKCYFMLGGNALKNLKYDEALKNFSKSAELADLYGDAEQTAVANGWIAKIYQIQAGDAFNRKDYTAASEIFAKGYAANPENTELALKLAMCYCEMSLNSSDISLYEKGVDIYEAVAVRTDAQSEDAAARAKRGMTSYTEKIITKQKTAADFDNIIALADTILEKNPSNAVAKALFEKVRLQAYANKQDYAKVIALGQAAADAQPDSESQSLIYYLIGSAYRAQEQKSEAIAAFEQVTNGSEAAAAKTALEELTQ